MNLQDILPGAASAEPQVALAESFAGLMVQLHLRLGGNAAAALVVRQAAALACLAATGGHACVDLAGDAPEEAALRGEAGVLAASPVVATPGATEGPRPLVLDAAGRLYLYRYWDYEGRLAARMVEMNTAAAEDDAALGAALAAYFPPPADGSTDWQAVAAATAVARRLAVISGGPGTGKTTTIARVLLVLLRLRPDLRMALAAPTGKAAARMQEALAAQLATLADAADAADRLPRQAHTVHRLLGMLPGSQAPRHHPGHPLPYDLVIVDEASMLDLALATRLVEALPQHGRLVLLGDKDQLAAVETGAVFAELCRRQVMGAPWRARLGRLLGREVYDGETPGGEGPGPAAHDGAAAAEGAARAGEETATAAGGAASDVGGAAPDVGGAAPAGGLGDAVVCLRRSYRFGPDSALGRLAARVNAGDGAGAVALLRADAGPQLQWHTASADARGLAAALLEGYGELVAALREGREPARVLAALESHRVLCALRHGARGAAGLNVLLGAGLRRLLGQADDGAAWWPGRPVLVTANDAALRVFNGDVGIVLADGDGALAVHFPAAGGGTRAIAAGRLPACDTALAMTIHKAQGSEFDRVAVVLPELDARVLTRELIYTALTRARHGVGLWAPEDVLLRGIARRTMRASGLGDRLAGSVTGEVAGSTAGPFAVGAASGFGGQSHIRTKDCPLPRR
ncbi:MAG: AAA family ATPase [Betaproteobacteria bacterium]|nr:AAA family ATPase [Betaproteobacteria bacterium]